jgi:hypothetical protein
MYELLARTVSQALQGFVPAAVAFAWFHATSRASFSRDAVAGLRIAFIAALPGTVAAAYLFQRSTRQSLLEAALASIALLIAGWFVVRGQARASDDNASRSTLRRASFAGGALLLILRQSMEIGAVVFAVLQVGSAAHYVSLASGIAIGLAAAAAWMAFAKRAGTPSLERATRTFAILFLAQTALYCVHEASESGLLPWSEAIHAATEPYGPDGAYGRYISALVVAVPLLRLAAGVPRRAPAWRGGLRWAALGAVIVMAAAVLSISARRAHDAAPGPLEAADVDAEAVARTLASPHLLVRLTSSRHYGRLGIVPLATPETEPVTAGLACDRVAYAGGQGVCLVADGGFDTKYFALFFDRELRLARRLEVSGRPSRTRVSPDGTLAATTVFESGLGHDYAIDGFATRTTIFDLRDGSALGNLESFTALENGRRFAEKDFNYWGVTFARDGGVFYATLQTGGRRYLVRGDAARRTVSLLLENVECPAISPDNRHLAYKKRVRPGPAPWQFYVLDLQTMAERPLAETRSIDDQLEWLDDGHVLYAAPMAAQGPERDVWVMPIDGSAPPKVFLRDAESPVVVR